MSYDDIAQFHASLSTTDTPHVWLVSDMFLVMYMELYHALPTALNQHFIVYTSTQEGASVSKRSTKYNISNLCQDSDSIKQCNICNDSCALKVYTKGQLGAANAVIQSLKVALGDLPDQRGWNVELLYVDEVMK